MGGITDAEPRRLYGGAVAWPSDGDPSRIYACLASLRAM